MLQVLYRCGKINRTNVEYIHDRPDLIAGSLYIRKECFPDNSFPPELVVEIRSRDVQRIDDVAAAPKPETL